MWSIWLVFCGCGFHSVCPLMEKDKRLMEASSWETLTERETGSCSDGTRYQEISPEYSLEGLMLKLKLWPPDTKNWLIGKDSDAGKDGRQEEKGMTQDEMVRWHHRLDGHEFEQAPGVGDGQGSLASCSSWGRKEFNTTEQLNWSLFYFSSLTLLFFISLLFHWFLLFNDLLLLLFYRVV